MRYNCPVAVFREPRRKDWIETALLVSFLVLFVAGLAFALAPAYPLLFIPLAILSLLALVTWHARTSGYKCERCGAVFQVSAFADFISANGLDGKYVKCPACKKREWRKVLKRYRPRSRS